MSSPGRTTGSAPVQTPQKRRPWWLLALLALVALGLLLFGLSRCGTGTAGDGPDPAGAPTAAGPAAPDAADPGAATDADGGAGPGTLEADGTPLLPVAAVSGPDGELTSQLGRTATASASRVQSVPSDEGFWVGSSDVDRWWVQLEGTAESGYRVQPGDAVDFTGQIVAHDAGFAAGIGVDAAEGADQLTGQAAHIQVAQADLRRSAG